MSKTTIWLLLTYMILNAHKSDAQQKKTTMTISYDTTKQCLLTAKEREYAIQSLEETQSAVFSAVKGLNQAQLTFKPADDIWSIEECIKHIAAAEQKLWGMIDESLKQPANPEKRAEIKFTDEALMNAVKDRSHKSKTFAALEPSSSPYKTLAEALTSFKENREKLIAFVGSTQEDLRNHVLVLPIGTYDTYQFILVISAHSNRHTQQIEELKANVDFPR